MDEVSIATVFRPKKFQIIPKPGYVLTLVKLTLLIYNDILMHSYSGQYARYRGKVEKT